MSEIDLEDLLPNNTTFSHLDVPLQEKILAKRIIFQGEETTLKDILTPTRSVDFDEIIDSDLLSRFSDNEEISVGVAVSTLNEDVQGYITRSFHHGEQQITEERLCEYKESRWHEIITIMNPPGSGKSTVLDHMAVILKKKHPHLWVINIDLKDYSDAFSMFKEEKVRTVSIIDLLNARQESRIKDGLERKIFNIPHKVVLFIDGIDEVSSDYMDIMQDIMSDYHKHRNLARVYVASSNNMDETLQAQLWSRSQLVEFSDENQILLLKNYLERGIAAPTGKEKCKIYAEKLIRQKWFREDEHALVGVPLQIRMLGKVLCGIENWKDYYEFLSVGNSDLSRPKKINLVRLYLLYIHSCCENKTCLTEDMLREDITKLNEKFQYSLYVLALEEILTKKQHELFNCHKNRVQKKSEELLRLNIVKKVDILRFSHRTVAEYFLADCIAYELHQTENKEFFTFFIETILTRNEFRLVRLFIDSFIGTVLKSIPNQTLKGIGYMVVESDKTVLHYLLQKGCVEIFKFLFKCLELAGLHLDFDIVRLGGETILQTAISAGQSDMMELLVEKGASVKSRDDNERTALYNAVNTNNLGAVKFLVGKGAEVNCRDITGRTLLHEAAACASLDIVEYLLSQGAVIDCRDRQGLTPLHDAVKSGDFNKVKYLVENNVDVNSRSKTGTPLFDAVNGGHISIVKYLLENGAEVKFKNTRGSTVLHNRKERDEMPCENVVEIFKLLVESGADINAIDRDGVAVLHSYIHSDNNIDVVRFLVENGVDFKRLSKGIPALTRAIQSGAIKIVKYLLENDATLFSKHLIFIAIERVQFDLVRYFTEKLAEKGIDLDVRAKQASILLRAAVGRNDVDFIKFLMEKGVDINTKGMSGTVIQQAIQQAFDRSSFEMVKFLVESGASIEGSLEEAARKGDLSLVKYLMEIGADAPVIRNIGGNFELLQFLIEKGVNVDMRCILDDAVTNGDLNIVKYLIERGVDVNGGEYCWYTPLLQAAKYDQLHIVNLLLKNGARINDTDWKKETALHKAFRHDNLEVAEFLAEKGADVKEIINVNRQLIINFLFHFRKKTFVLEHITSVNVDNRPDSYMLAVWLKYGAFDAAECLVKKSVGAYRSVADAVNHYIEIEDSELVGLVFEHSTTVKYLLEQGLRIGVEEFHRYNTLHRAVSLDDLKFVKCLVDEGVDVNKKDEQGNTALHKACHFSTVKYLVGRGADVNAQTNDGWRVLHEAVASRTFDVCEFLVDSGANVNNQDKNGRTALYVAATKGSYTKLAYLIGKGAKFTTDENRKVLHEVIRFNDLDLLKYLVENGAEVEGKDEEGRTVLYKVVESGDLEILKYLVTSGASVKVTDNKSVSLYQYASNKCDSDIVSYLKSMGARNRVKKT